MEGAQQQQQGPKLPPGVLQHYNKLKQEYSELFRTQLDLEEEKREHELVIDAIKDLEADRKCWRLVGGVLIEKQQSEVMLNLKEGLEQISKTHDMYQEQIKGREKALIEFETKYNLRPNRDASQGQQQKQQSKQNTGVLA
ncbi:Prefoldin [Pseudocohnilembus persalinus]|uniref:Prefoldin n=1 Tax=Pseudocohnilembus persalinus TaxID=266149 RepID=A0A0V0R0Y6_PSEPJ|nr:Prefoldin [Pseudocohnilembus persalinus]|eukprot:KRX07946.1 Prefoldin [Pseudocohnilembus persalinus]